MHESNLFDSSNVQNSITYWNKLLKSLIKYELLKKSFSDDSLKIENHWLKTIGQITSDKNPPKHSTFEVSSDAVISQIRISVRFE